MSTHFDRFGDYLLEKALASECKRAGLVNVSALLSFGNVEYLWTKSEAGSPAQAIVMLHGAAADKTSWVRFSGYLNSGLALVIPDLPGHGKSTAEPNLDYGIHAQAERLVEFLAALGIKRAHLIGNSMGGTIAIRLASLYTGLVASLILIDAAGFDAAPSWLRGQVALTGINPMIEVRDASGYRAMMRIGMQAPPYIPGIMVAALAREFSRRQVINQKIVQDIERDLNQSDNLPKVVAPCLIIWGAADKVEHVDNADYLQRRLPNSRKIVLEGIGHVPMVEAPKQVAAACRAFFADVAA